MSNKHIEELLQQCIAAFDAGLSPEECLSAFPAARAELEPLFRQAVSLRVAFAAAPRAEFRERTRERLLFAAGRDVSAAFAAQPDPDFVNDARQRFIRAAGAEAQEALRAVPPPRLPFWMNTRRRLLEAAAVSRPQPVARPMGGVFALRTGLSLAVVVLAMAVAALGYTIGFNNAPAGNAQFAKFEQDLSELQQAQAAGLPISEAKVQQLTTQAAQLAEQPAVSEKLPELINRQKDVINAAANEGLLTPALAQAQTQQLAAAEAKAELRLAAARAEEPTSTPEPAPTNTPAPPASRTPVATTPVPAATPPPPGVALTTGQIRVGEVEDDKRSVETANISFAVPASWALLGQIQLDEGDSGFGELDISQLQFQIQGDDRLLVDLDTGRITVLLGGTQFVLRTGGVRGELISRDDLQAKAGLLLGELTLVRDSIELSGSLVPPPPTATPTNTATPANTATPTATPPATSSPAPSATP